MDKRVIINCIIIILIWICNRMAYYYLSGNTSLTCEWHNPNYWLLNNVEVQP